jgi:hypothetical protein
MRFAALKFDIRNMMSLTNAPTGSTIEIEGADIMEDGRV